ncbi:thiol-activated cytolysin family protein [Bacteroides heparinolyticus]|uniref:thiol-activated cytolysin family protein n=1 Tax=Prevotella heparinolytica TaxID=28113 RepID=UPI0023F9B671|nr:thiol-activated cytolysin family protein [Bacteroides heparinolyticus]MCI6212197.1 thiol-activated cytolysin family protein [Bacteroides heparinolyticus]
MKKYYAISILSLLLSLISCERIELEKTVDHVVLPRFSNSVKIDSTYTYPQDTLYKTWLRQYNSQINAQTRSLSPEDEAFFNKQYTVKSTESALLYGKNYIFPGAILEGNSISDQKYIPVFVNNRNPITVSMTLSHNTPKQTSRTISTPSYSKLNDYVKEMVVDGNFSQNEKFMFQYRQFSFYDEIKSAFGTNINTKKLFSSKKESSTEYKHKISKSIGMYVKFFQSSFTVNMDIAPLSNSTITGNSGYEPVYVNSVTYGRMGVLVFETDETYNFAEQCIKKEFERIFLKKSSTLTTEERMFFEQTDFKVLILGADSDYAVQSFKGYSYFLNLIYNSQFTQYSYGVPIMCSFSYANSHGLVETEFVNTVYIEPLYVDVTRENSSSYDERNYSSSMYLNFYHDRAKTKPAIPATDIIFTVNKYESTCQYYPDYQHWPMIKIDCTDKQETLNIRNISFKSRIFVGTNRTWYESTGPMPSGKPSEPVYTWSAHEEHCLYTLSSSPFYIII